VTEILSLYFFGSPKKFHSVINLRKEKEKKKKGEKKIHDCLMWSGVS
jgi:hypothetical protein